MEPPDSELRTQLKLISLEELRVRVPQKLATYEAHDPNKERTAPLLQALFDFAPTAAGQQTVAVDILACATSDSLEKLADQYLYNLIAPIRAAGGRTPPVSYHPSRPAPDSDAIVNSYLAEPAKCDLSALRELVLRRDDYRCVVNGRVDANSIETDKTQWQQGDVYSSVDVAHILPFSLMPSSESNPALVRSGAIWQVISAFSSIPLDVFNGDNINRPENGIALDHMLYLKFGTLSLCLEPTDAPDTYSVVTWAKHPELFGFRDTVSFASRAGIPVPDRRFLALHAACAKVVHRCGMAETLDELLEDLERTTVLSSDGASADLLHHALAMISV